MSVSAKTPPSPHALRVADLSAGQPTTFALEPDSAARAEIAAQLDISGVRKLRLVGSVRPQGKSDWVLEATLGATVVQPCAVTLAPVATRIDEPVTRIYLRDYTDPDAPEMEMPDDDTTEALGPWIDLQAVMIEALTLALPLYPRAPDAQAEQSVFAEPGVAPMTDEDARPFAGLSALRDKLDNKD